MLVIWVSLLDWRTKRDTSTRSGTNAGTSGEGVFRRGSAAGEGAMPASGAGANSKWRWGGAARGGDEKKKKAAEPGARNARHCGVGPRRLHDKPPSTSPPVHCRFFVGVMLLFRFFEVFLGFASCRRLSGPGHHEAQADVHRRQARTTSKVKRTTTRHDSPVLIFDDLKYDPFTKNRRWP